MRSVGQCRGPGGMLFAGWVTASVIRHHVVAPLPSPAAASSSARVLLSLSAFSPQRLSIRLAARQISISGITRRKPKACDLETLNASDCIACKRRVKVGKMAPILTAKDVVRRIAAECAYVDKRGGVGIRLEPAAAIVRQFGEQFGTPRRRQARRQPKAAPLL